MFVVFVLLVGVVECTTSTTQVTSWFSGHPGASLSEGIELRSMGGNRGFGFVAREPLKAGTVVIRAPRTLNIWAGSVLARFPEWASLRLSNISLVALLLAVEHFHLAEDTWTNAVMGTPRKTMQPYLDMLKDCSNAFTMGSRELATLERLSGGMQSPPRTLLPEYKKLRKSGFLDKGFNVTLEQMKWAWCQVTSRSWAGPLMIPVMDFLNHSPQPNAVVNLGFSGSQEQLDEAQRKVRSSLEWWMINDHVVLLTKDVKSGEEITIQYGASSNGFAQVFSYGFLDVGSPFNFVALPIPISSPQKRFMLESIFRGSNPVGKETFVSMSLRGFHPRDVAVLRILSEPDKGLDSFFYTRIHNRSQEWIPSPQNEASMLMLLLSSAMKQFGDTFSAFDQKALAAGQADVMFAKLVASIESRPEGPLKQVLRDVYGLLTMLVKSIIESIKAYNKR